MLLRLSLQSKDIPVKILLADDHGLFRDSMAIWLKQYADDIEIEFASDWDSLNQQLKGNPDLIMLDLGMPGMSGAASIFTIKKQLSDTPILVVSANEDEQTIQACLDCGASGYITKSSSGQEILKAVSSVLDGQIYLPKMNVEKGNSIPTQSLSKKQFELLSFLAKGESNRHIAEHMHLSEGTIKQYVSQLLDILDVDNRTQAGNKARKILGFSS